VSGSFAGGSALRGDDPVVIVGGGVLGLCLAYYLVRADVPVQIVERHTLGSGASWGNAGWVCASHSAPIPAPGVMRDALCSVGRPDSPLYLRPFPDPQFASWLWRFWRSTTPQRFRHGYEAVANLNRPTFDLFDELSSAGVDTTLRRVGMVHAFRSASAARRFIGIQRAMADGRYDVADEISEGDAASNLDPALTRAVRAAYLVPGEGVVDPGGLIAGLTKAVIERGADIREHTEVIGLVRRHGAVVAVRTTADELTCSAVAITAGTWSAQLLRMVDCRIPLQAGKGYSFTVDLDPAPRHALYLGDRKIAVSPLAGTTTRIAGTMELSGNNRRLDWRRIVAVARGSRDYLGPWFADPDDLATQIRDPWVGARPLLPDGIPLIDRLSTDSNVFVATGHGMLGVTLGPATGSALADYLRTGRRPATLVPFTIDRR
jgi:glycine/D-amino acid oxidase-like deaminating enzyme